MSTTSKITNSHPRMRCNPLKILSICPNSPSSSSSNNNNNSKLLTIPLTKILPFLYLGSSIDAFDYEKLISLNITHILNVSITIPDPPDSLKLKGYKRIPVIDSFNQDIMSHFEEAFIFIGKLKLKIRYFLVFLFISN